MDVQMNVSMQNLYIFVVSSRSTFKNWPWIHFSVPIKNSMFTFEHD